MSDGACYMDTPLHLPLCPVRKQMHRCRQDVAVLLTIHIALSTCSLVYWARSFLTMIMDRASLCIVWLPIKATTMHLRLMLSLAMLS